jgi:hypothetical protein
MGQIEIAEIARFEAPPMLERQLLTLQRNALRALTAVNDTLRSLIPRVRLLTVTATQSEESLNPNEILLADATAAAIILKLRTRNGSWQAHLVATSTSNSVSLQPVLDLSGPVTKRAPRINGLPGPLVIGNQTLATVVCDGQDFWVRT